MPRSGAGGQVTPVLPYAGGIPSRRVYQHRADHLYDLRAGGHCGPGSNQCPVNTI